MGHSLHQGADYNECVPTGYHVLGIIVKACGALPGGHFALIFRIQIKNVGGTDRVIEYVASRLTFTQTTQYMA